MITAYPVIKLAPAPGKSFMSCVAAANVCRITGYKKEPLSELICRLRGRLLSTSLQIFYFVKIVFLLLSVGCTPLPQRDPAFAASMPPRPPVQDNGAIYQAGYDMRLYEDNKARKVGDVVTIVLNESTQANKKDDLNSKKNNNISVTTPTLFGLASNFLTGNDLATQMNSSKQYSGSGAADQSNSLKGNISVTVVEVLPNGNLRVRGEKRVTLNQGDEYIRLSGIVRPVDLDTSNTVSSGQVADATIMYTGNGAMADASKMGWLSRILFSSWFPF